MRKSWFLIAVGVCLSAGIAPAQESPALMERIQQRIARTDQQPAAPLTSATVGDRLSPTAVTPPGTFSLALDGALDLGGYVFRDGTPFIHNDGGALYGNTAVGLNAFISATLGAPYYNSGAYNTAFGYRALRDNTGGRRNTAAGYRAMRGNTLGDNNTALGSSALYLQ